MTPQTAIDPRFAYRALAADLVQEGATANDPAELNALAARLIADARAWRGLTDRLGAVAARLDEHRAVQLVAESVFDEVLAPGASRVLAAALALARDADA